MPLSPPGGYIEGDIKEKNKEKIITMVGTSNISINLNINGLYTVKRQRSLKWMKKSEKWLVLEPRYGPKMV